MYCIYTDREVPEAEGNLDHIFPLSLGGDNKFTIWAERKFNSTLGTEVDGAIANDPLVMFARRDADARGHGGSEPVPKFKKSQFGGEPAQLSFGKDAVKVWDAKSRSYLPQEQIEGQTIESQFKLDPRQAIRFVAKVALGGGYFVYGDAIRKAMDCDELRRLISFNPETSKREDFQGSKIKIADRYHPDVKTNTHVMMHKDLVEFRKRSTLICVPYHGWMGFHIGVLGMFMGTIAVPADITDLPNDMDLNDLGRALILGPGEFQQMSYRQLAIEYHLATTGTEPELPPKPC
jgi:hypothetical protein